MQNKSSKPKPALLITLNQPSKSNGTIQISNQHFEHKMLSESKPMAFKASRSVQLSQIIF